jgi:hypothetical protein
MPFAKILQVVSQIVDVIIKIAEHFCESKNSKKEEKRP